MLRSLALAMTLTAGACGSDFFACEHDEDCKGGASAGVCAEAGACAFPDTACTSGHRYGEHAGAHSGRCVSDDATTSGIADGGTPGSTTRPLETSTSVEAADTTVPITTATESSGTGSTTGPEPSTSSDTTSESTTGPSIDPDLLVWLRFEAPDRDAFANDGVLAGTASCTAGCPTVAEGLATFDGVDDCLAYPHHDELVDTPVTLAAWVWSASDSEGMFLLGKATGDSSQNTWELYLNHEILTGQRLGFEMYGPPDVAVSTPITYGSW
ncbi:MAG: hypothetical protein IAG13_37620, partial [Deltaproteobacteria bacterium]|nr:hypothetical protein [Nannocystaceae bacterium]